MPINQLKAGAILSYVAIGLNNIVGLLYTPYMLRMLGQNEYGLYSLVASVVAYLTVLDLGFANAIVRYTAKFRAENKIQEQYEMFGMFFILYCGIGLIAFLIGLGLYFNVDALFDATMNAKDLYKIRVMMLLMVFNIAFTFPMSIWGAIITAYENFVFQKLVNIARIILNPLVMILLLSMGYKAIAMVVVITLFNVATLCINAWYCKYRLNIKVKFARFKLGFLKEVSVYSLWIFLDAIVSRFYSSAGQIILGMYQGASVVAIYALAIQLKSLFTSFSTAFNSVLLPKATSLCLKGNVEEINNLFIRVGRMQFFVISFMLLVFTVFGREFIILWGGANYEQTYYIALILLFPFSLDLISNVGITVLQAKNKLKYRSIPMIIGSVLGLIVSIPFTKNYGIYGCVYTIAIVIFCFNVISSNIVFCKIAKIDVVKYWKEIIGMIWFPIITVCICFYLKQYLQIDSVYCFILSLCVFSICYLPFFLLVNMSEAEKSEVKRVLRMIKYRVG